MKKLSKILLISLFTLQFGLLLKAQTASINGANLYLNPLTTNLGIGVNNPISKLHINATTGQSGLKVQLNGVPKLTVASNGGVSIGGFTETPPANGLSVNDKINVYTTGTGARLNLKQGWGDWIHFEHITNAGFWAFHNNEAQDVFTIYYQKPDGSKIFPLAIGTDAGLTLLDIFPAGGRNLVIGDDTYLSDVDRTNILGIYSTANNDRAGIQLGSNQSCLIFGVNGNIGIGTEDPKGYKLAVAGSMIAEKVVVKLQSNWPDYVFDQNHKLKSLPEIESYIKEHKHLEGVPSELEVQKTGVDVVEMDAILLKKIEEMTLLMIEQNKTIQALQVQIEMLKKQ